METPELAGDRDSGQSRQSTLRILLPALWIALLMVLGLRSLFQTWPLLADFALPDDVVTWLWFGIAISVVNLLWGSWLLGQAYRRAPSFAGAFVIWQVFNIAAILVSAAYTSFSGSFVPQASTLAMMAGEVAVGIGLVAFVRRTPSAASSVGQVPASGPPALVLVINGMLGAIAGGVALMFAGFFAGTVIAEIAEISCFEGGCGYFAAAIGVLGLLIGVVVGAVAAVWLTRRRARRAPA